MNNIHHSIKQYLRKTGYERFALKAVLFDMDGVLYDTMPDHACSWEKTMKKYGLTMTANDVYLNEGRIGVDQIDVIAKRGGLTFSREERNRIYQEKTDIFMSCPPAAVMPSSLELLQKVKSRNLFAMLVTGSKQPSLINRIFNDFPDIFTRDNMVTAHDVQHGKPHPEPYLMAILKGGLQTNEAIVVKNAPLGIESASAAGLFVIAVNTGILPDALLLDAGANLLFPSLNNLSIEWESIYDSLQFIAQK